MTTRNVTDDLDQAIAITDRGLAYGDGCFTTALVINGEISLLEQHLNRLQDNSFKLGITDIDIESLRKEMCLKARPIDLGVIKVIITAGSGGRGYSRIGCQSPTIILSLHDYPHHYKKWQQEGIALEISEQQLGHNPMLAGLKHLNRLEQVLLRAELDKKQCDELLVTDIAGNVVECCSANVFWLKGNQWYTPQMASAGVAGLMRAELLRYMPEIIEARAQVSDLVNVDAMFITNAILGIVPVRQFCDLTLNISSVKRFQDEFLVVE